MISVFPRSVEAMAAVQVGKLKVGMIPGTGRMGSLLATHLAKAGVPIFLGSRSADKATEAAHSLSLSLPLSPPLHIQGGSNAQAAAWAHIIVWSPNGSLQDREALLQSLAPHLENKIIIDITNVMYFFDESRWGQTSSVLLNQKALGVPARWTTAFKSTFWVFKSSWRLGGMIILFLQKLLEELPDPENPHHTFVAGDDEEAILATIALVEAIPGFKALRAGGLVNSKIIELLSPRWLIELDKLNAGGRFRSGWKYIV